MKDNSLLLSTINECEKYNYYITSIVKQVKQSIVHAYVCKILKYKCMKIYLGGIKIHLHI